MASTILQRIRPRVRGVSEGGGGVGACKCKGCLSEVMHVDQGASVGTRLIYFIASRVTHTGSTFAFRKRWGQIDWRSLGKYKT